MILYIVAAILIVAFDQITKILTSHFFSLGEAKVIIPNILSFTNVHNEGAAFGILQGARVFFIIMTLAVIVFIAIYLIKTKPQSRLERWAICFMAGGAVGNFIDRAFLSYVRDFIMVEFIEFPVFNIADCFVCIGAGLYILYAFSDMFKKKEEKETDDKLIETDSNG
ncbi:MAG: signal peptidase II [Ruminococcaceae bacterium]|nr:signal peptidase II [Oscillospiraceae bacterium]